MNKKSWIEELSYPSGWMKEMYKTPLLFYRLGLGFLVGRLFMVLTTTGRKSGQPRRTAIEFHEFKNHPTVISAWGLRADWYRNLSVNPLATVQTWRGAQSVLARRIITDEELASAFLWVQSNPTMRSFMNAAGFEMPLEKFLAVKERFIFVTFEPTVDSTPPALKADLVWVWVVFLLVCVLLAWVL